MSRLLAMRWGGGVSGSRVIRNWSDDVPAAEIIADSRPSGQNLTTKPEPR
jgi:hypothetical protein